MMMMMMSMHQIVQFKLSIPQTKFEIGQTSICPYNHPQILSLGLPSVPCPGAWIVLLAVGALFFVRHHICNAKPPQIQLNRTACPYKYIKVTYINLFCSIVGNSPVEGPVTVSRSAAHVRQLMRSFISLTL